MKINASVWEKPQMEVPRTPKEDFEKPLIMSLDSGRLRKYIRCTTFIKAPEDTYRLGLWEQRKVAEGMALREELGRSAASFGPEPEDGDPRRKPWSEAMDDLCKRAKEAAKAKAKADDGSTLHKLAERQDLGLEMGAVPEIFQRHLDAYAEATAEFTAHHVERFMVLDSLKIGGTPDRIIEIPGHDKLIIADLKTGKIDYPAAMAMQLAVYAHSELYDPANGKRTPVDVDQEKGLIIALGVKTGVCELHWIDIAEGWEGVRVARDVREWRTKKTFLTPYDGQGAWTSRDLVAEAQAALTIAIDQVSTPEDLVALWVRYQGSAWTPAHTEQAAERKAAMLTKVA